MSTRLTLSLLLMAAVLCACSPQAQRTDKITPRDPAVFASAVQPYLELACASLDCHGADGRPLRIYSELGRRANDGLRPVPISNAHEPVAITSAELDANRLAFAAVALSSSRPDLHLALLKPLASSADGINHVGGVHWESKTDPGYLCLRGWLVADIVEDTATACTQATAKLQR